MYQTIIDRETIQNKIIDTLTEEFNLNEWDAHCFRYFDRTLADVGAEPKDSLEGVNLRMIWEDCFDIMIDDIGDDPNVPYAQPNATMKDLVKYFTPYTQ